MKNLKKLIQEETKKYLGEQGDQTMNYPPEGAGMSDQDRVIPNNPFHARTLKIFNAPNRHKAFRTAREAGLYHFDHYDPKTKKVTSYPTLRADEDKNTWTRTIQDTRRSLCHSNPSACRAADMYMPDDIKHRDDYLAGLDPEQQKAHWELVKRMGNMNVRNIRNKEFLDKKRTWETLLKQNPNWVNPKDPGLRKENKSLRTLEKILREIIAEEAFPSKRRSIIETVDAFSYETPEHDTKSLLGEEDLNPFDAEDIADSTVALRNTIGEELAKNHPEIWARVERKGYKLDFSYLTPEEEQIKNQVYKRAFSKLSQEAQAEVLKY